MNKTGMLREQQNKEDSMKLFDMLVIGTMVIGLIALVVFFIVVLILIPSGNFHVFQNNAVGIGPVNDLWLCLPSWAACPH